MLIAIKQVMDEQQHFLPATVNGLQDENRGMRDQIKSLKEKLGNEERAAKVIRRGGGSTKKKKRDQANK